MFALLVLWFGISVPLVYLGSYSGFRKESHSILYHVISCFIDFVSIVSIDYVMCIDCISFVIDFESMPSYYRRKSPKQSQRKNVVDNIIKVEKIKKIEDHL